MAPDTRGGRALAVLPLKNTVVFPHLLVPLAVGRPRSLRLLDDLPVDERTIVVAAQYDESVEDATFEQIHHVGTRVQIQHLLKMPDGTVQIAVQGVERVSVVRVQSERPYLRCDVTPLPDAAVRGESAIDLEALTRSAQASFQRLVAVAPYLPTDLLAAALAIQEQSHLAYFLAHHVRLTLEQRQEVLELDGGRDKLELLLSLMAHEQEVLEVGRRIQSQAEESIGRSQREYFLREQQRAISRELGEVDQEAAEAAELRAKVEAAGMGEEARREADRELARLERIPSASPESSIVRTYLETLCGLPWQRSTAGELDVQRARKVLDSDHWALDKVKQRIVEHLAVRRLRTDRGLDSPHREPILCFVGPPGVGKTSLGRSIARAMRRTFARASLGGVHDEAEIRGHRRTYIGAMPGRIIQAIRRAESNDPVFMLDEIDKLAADWRGDPSSALLEVLDPEQNKEFRDNYLDVPFDLSRVMFICTANTLETVPDALRDRLEVLQLAGYTEDEKVQIAKRFLIPKQVQTNGLRRSEVRLPERIVRLVIRDYTREAGVRNLERELAGVLRRGASAIAAGEAEPPIRIDEARVREALGTRRYLAERAERTVAAGIATGLTWSPVGGDIVFVEASRMPGTGRLQLTGQLGDVMKESANAALSYLKAHAEEMGIEREAFEKQDVHVHVPAGAIRKEGPSAGVTMLTAITSVLSGKPVRADLAMTGEITLRGRVLPIGGLKEKLLAAHRAGIRRVLVPRPNEADLDDLPPELRRSLRIVLVDDVGTVLREAIPGLGGTAPVRAGRARAGAPTRGAAQPPAA
ncbi:MAG: endopeptidase La [Candidatus Dormibacteraceae bacterium]